MYAAPLDVVFSHLDVVEPDLLFVSTARFDILTQSNVEGAPDLVVEIGSPRTRRRDEILKRSRYLRAQELTMHHSNVLTTPLLPGLELTLAEIFAE